MAGHNRRRTTTTISGTRTGPSTRLLFGSDWPVCLLAAPYERVFDAAVETLARLSVAERASVLGATAATVYRLTST